MISRTKVTVRFAETDKNGIVHYSVYPIWYEIARAELLKKCGVVFSNLVKNGVKWPIVEMNCKYSASAEQGDTLNKKTSIAKVTTNKIVFNYEVYKAGFEKPINEGTTMHAWIGKNSKTINLKKEYPELFAKIEGLTN